MEKLPKHVAIIMDGNGRWAKQRGLLRVEGHRQGVNAVQRAVKFCLEKKITCLSVFAFSSENWSRPSDEVAYLMQLFLDVLETELEALQAQSVCLRFLGHIEGLPEILQWTIRSVESATSANQALTLNILVNYGGRWDIMQATKNIVHACLEGQFNVEELTESSFDTYLSTQAVSPPDLLIRTSGEQRISNCFLWQLAYTELYFSDVLWPDFDERIFQKALDEYARRHRRYGRVLRDDKAKSYV